MPRRKRSLCSVDVHVPTQFLSSQIWDVHAYVWFPPQEEVFAIEDDSVTLRFGFQYADLQLRARSAGGDARLTAHTEVEFASVSTKLHEEQKRSIAKEASLRAALSLTRANNLSMGGSNRNTSEVSSVSEETSTLTRYTLESIDHDTWRMHGTANEHGILSGRVVNQEPLCCIEHGNMAHTLEASVIGKTASLFIAVIAPDGSAFKSPNQHNRDAVISAIISQSISVHRIDSGESNPSSFLLARCKAVFRPNERNVDDVRR